MLPPVRAHNHFFAEFGELLRRDKPKMQYQKTRVAPCGLLRNDPGRQLGNSSVPAGSETTQGREHRVPEK